MPNHKYKKTNNIQGNVSPTEPSYLTTVSLETQENHLKTYFMKMLEVFKEAINKSLKECHESQDKANIWRKPACAI